MPILPPAYYRVARERDRLLRDARELRRALNQVPREEHDAVRLRREAGRIARALRTWSARAGRNPATLYRLLVRLERLAGD